MKNHKQTRAFTLIETVISLSIMSVLLLGLSGAVMISTHAIPSASDTGIEDQAVIDALNHFRDDLRQATEIDYNSSGSEEKLKLKIKDSGAKGVPAELEYRYITASNSFARKVKGRSEEILLSNISGASFQFTQEASNATIVHVIILATETIQQIFELHVALPEKPVLQ